MIFSEQKIAQMAAFFLIRRGGRMSYLKLMKLLYLADRESMDRYGESMSADVHYSMPHGPVLSETLNLITGQKSSPIWRDMIYPCENYEVALTHPDFVPGDLEELSEADVEILDEVWKRFGHMTRFDLVQYTHQHLPEWVDPNGSSRPIDPRATFAALGYARDQADALAKNIFERKALGRVLSGLV